MKLQVEEALKRSHFFSFESGAELGDVDEFLGRRRRSYRRDVWIRWQSYRCTWKHTGIQRLHLRPMLVTGIGGSE